MDHTSTQNPDFDGYPDTIYAAENLASVVRCIIRGSASAGARTPFRASGELETIANLLSSDPNICILEVIERAIDLLAVDDPGDDLRSAILSAAESGAKYLMEASANDGFGKARASRHWADFIQDIEAVHAMREANRRRWTK